jgi:hypothetical protein
LKKKNSFGFFRLETLGNTTELVQSAVKVLPAGLGIDRDQHAGVSAVLGVERAGLHLELAHRVEDDLRVLAVVGAHVGVDRAVQVDVVHAAPESVHVEGIGVVETPGGNRSGRWR